MVSRHMQCMCAQEGSKPGAVWLEEGERVVAGTGGCRQRFLVKLGEPLTSLRLVLLAGAVCGRSWTMGRKVILYLPLFWEACSKPSGMAHEPRPLFFPSSLHAGLKTSWPGSGPLKSGLAWRAVRS